MNLMVSILIRVTPLLPGLWRQDVAILFVTRPVVVVVVVFVADGGLHDLLLLVGLLQDVLLEAGKVLVGLPLQLVCKLVIFHPCSKYPCV